MTDREMTTAIINALQQLHTGREWVCFPELRLGSGYGGKWEQRIDVFAMSCYPSHGLQSIAYEVKSSRSDFLRELKEPEKRRAAMDLSNMFYFAAPAGMIQTEELPLGCGLKEYRDGKVSTVCQATFRDRQSPEWRFVASLCRRIMLAQELPTHTSVPPSYLDGLGLDEINFLARTLADARSQYVATVLTNEQSACVLDRAAALLRESHPRK